MSEELKGRLSQKGRGSFQRLVRTERHSIRVDSEGLHTALKEGTVLVS